MTWCLADLRAAWGGDYLRLLWIISSLLLLLQAFARTWTYIVAVRQSLVDIMQRCVLHQRL